MGHSGATPCQQGANTKRGWNVFYTYLGGFGNITPAAAVPIQSAGTDGSWFGWPTDPTVEQLCAAWFEAPDLAGQRKICEEMQVEFWQRPPTRRSAGMFSQPHSTTI